MPKYLKEINDTLDGYRGSITKTWDVTGMSDEQNFDLHDTEIDSFLYGDGNKTTRFSVKNALYDTLYLRNKNLPSILYYKEQGEEDYYYSHIEDGIENNPIIIGKKLQSESNPNDKPLYKVGLLKDTYKIHIPYNDAVYHALQALDENPMWPGYSAFMISKNEGYTRKEYEIGGHVSHSFYVLQKATEQQLEIVLNALLMK